MVTTASFPALVQTFAEVQGRRRRRGTPHPQEIRLAIMEDLARRFPSLEGASGLSPWQPLALIAWANFYAPPGTAAASTVRFLLGVWDPRRDWAMEGLAQWMPFNLAEACNVWSDDDRAAFAEWLETPFWP